MRFKMKEITEKDIQVSAEALTHQILQLAKQ
jgi:hypothetical protein